MSEMVQGRHGEFVEEKCCIEHEGKEFCAGGAWIMRRKDTGLREGILYLFRERHEHFVNYFVGTWDGSKKAHAVCLRTWRSNFGDERRSFYFLWEGTKFWGVNAGDNDVVRVREYKNQGEVR